MVIKQPKKLAALAIAALISTSAFAECFYSSRVSVQVPYKVDEIDHVAYMHSPNTCTVTARVKYRNKWHTIAGKAEDRVRPSMEICDMALTFAIKDFLLRANSKSIDAEQEMICTDLPTTRLRPVQKGEIIRASEVNPHPTRPDFINNGRECRWFTETESDHLGRLNSLNGVICKVGRANADQWYVVGKRLD